MKKNLVTKVMSLLLVGVMMLGLIACGNEQPKESSQAPAPSKSEAPAPSASKSEEAPAVEDTAVTYPMDTDVEVAVYVGGNATLNAEYNSYEESWWHSRVDDMTGIPTKWVPKVQDATAMEMMLNDKKEAPDLWLAGWAGFNGFKAYTDDGVAQELTDYVEYLPNYMAYLNDPANEAFKKDVVGENGEIYFIAANPQDARNRTYMGPMVRKDWLDACGLDIPVTIEDYEKVLVAFKDKYGVAFGGAWGDFASSFLGSGFDAAAHLTANFAVRDGKVVFECLSPEWQAMVEKFADWQKKGLLDGDIFTADRNVLRQKIAEDKVGMTVTAMSQLTNYIQDAEKAGSSAEWIAIPYPRTAAGAPTSIIQGYKGFNNYCVAMVHSKVDAEKMPVVLAWIDYFYSEEGIMFSNFGIEGETYTMNGEYPEFTALVTDDPAGMSQAVTKYQAHDGTFIGIQQALYLRAKNIKTPAVWEAISTWTENSVAEDHYLPSVIRTDDENTIYKDKWTPISTYTKQEIAAWVKGEKAIDWKAFETEVNKMGLQDVLKVQNDAYARWLAK